MSGDADRTLKEEKDKEDKTNVCRIRNLDSDNLRLDSDNEVGVDKVKSKAKSFFLAASNGASGNLVTHAMRQEMTGEKNADTDRMTKYIETYLAMALSTGLTGVGISLLKQLTYVNKEMFYSSFSEELRKFLDQNHARQELDDLLCQIIQDQESAEVRETVTAVMVEAMTGWVASAPHTIHLSQQSSKVEAVLRLLQRSEIRREILGSAAPGYNILLQSLKNSLICPNDKLLAPTRAFMLELILLIHRDSVSPETQSLVMEDTPLSPLSHVDHFKKVVPRLVTSSMADSFNLEDGEDSEDTIRLLTPLDFQTSYEDDDSDASVVVECEKN